MNLMVPTDALSEIDNKDLVEIATSDAADRYNSICDQLMDPEDETSKSINERVIEGRTKEKLDDGTEKPYPLFDPQQLSFPDSGRQPDSDMTDETEHLE